MILYYPGARFFIRQGWIWYTFGMNFEYNESKSHQNKEKHDINFIEAQKIWFDEKMLEVLLDFPDEQRWLCVGSIEEKYWTAVITFRGKNIRIISVRRSRKKEIEHYENS